MRKQLYILSVCLLSAGCADLDDPCYAQAPVFWSPSVKARCQAEGIPGPSFRLMQTVLREVIMNAPDVYTSTVNGPHGSTTATSYCSGNSCTTTVK